MLSGSKLKAENLSSMRDRHTEGSSSKVSKTALLLILGSVGDGVLSVTRFATAGPNAGAPYQTMILVRMPPDSPRLYAFAKDW